MTDHDSLPPPDEHEFFVFPNWANYLLPGLVLLGIGALTYLPLLFGLATAPETTDVGYAPRQPVPFSHQLHVGQLNMDCRYCHTTVEKTSFAAVPATQVCMNCHASINSDSPLLEPVRESFASGLPVNWIKVHDLPDFVYFDHSAHVNQGISCATCHGQVDEMETVFQHRPLSMAWCLECHRDPEPHLRPRDAVTDMQWDALQATGQSQAELGRMLHELHHIRGPEFMTSCTTCHR